VQVVNLALSPFLYSTITGEEVSSISEQVQTQSISGLLVFLVFVQFCVILFEFGIYLKKSVEAKVVLQWLTLGLYVYLYFVWNRQPQVGCWGAGRAPCFTTRDSLSDIAILWCLVRSIPAGANIVFNNRYYRSRRISSCSSSLPSCASASTCQRCKSAPATPLPGRRSGAS
jgi:hypothetical protein